MSYRLLRLGDGVVEYELSGPPDARDLLIFHVGSPSAAVAYPSLVAAAGRLGIRTVVPSRPGYGRSTRRPGRRVADEAGTAAVIADALGHRTFLTAGWSGGGPAALACAALLPDRVRACVTIASPSPGHEAGGEWRDWNAPELADEIEQLRSERRDALIPEFEAAAVEFAHITPRRLARRAASELERQTLLGEAGIGRALARSMRRAVSRGPWGWFDDNVAQWDDWGFRVTDVRVPVAVLHGELDALVDVRHGRWLASAIPGAIGVFPADRGHGSIVDPFESVVDRLVTLGGPGGA